MVLKESLSWRRILTPSLVFLSAIAAIQLVLSRVGLETPHFFRTLFYMGAAVSALVGYSLGKKTSRVLHLVVSGAVALASLFLYAYLLASFLSITLLNTCILFLLYSIGFGSLYACLRILYNRGLR
jgi:hypothetical protein